MRRWQAFGMLLFALAAGCCRAASWEQSAEVAYADADSPLAREHVDEAIRYAVAAWAARVDLPIRYSGSSAQPGYQRGTIVIRWLDGLDMLQAGSGIFSVATTRRWVYPNGAIAGAEIMLRRDSSRLRDGGDCFVHVILHEMGHALGIGHLAEKSALMHDELADCHRTLTVADIAAAPYEQHICHAELLAGRELYLPMVAANGRYFSARMGFVQGRWIVREALETLPHPDCADARLAGDRLVLKKIWSKDYVWEAEFARTPAGEWVLESAR